MKIYTKTGDKGETGMFGGKRVSKSSLRIEAVGSVDELNSVIGVAIAQVSSIKYKVFSIKKELIEIQNDLFEIGSVLASPNTKYQIQNTKYLMQRVKEFEELIDELTEKLPELRNFILPGGGIVGSEIHLARSIARRAERRIVELSKKEKIDSSILVYFNRLSDLLFTMARFANKKDKHKEILWNKSGTLVG